MRDEIKKVACELLIRDGYLGLRFGDIADRLEITRANIHYHFGKKTNLVDEVIEDYYRRTLQEAEAIWASDNSYEEKVRLNLERNRKMHKRFNTGRKSGGAPWSLISRMRLDIDFLSQKSQAHMRNFSTQMEQFIVRAIEQAQAQGEIAEDAPVKDIAVQIGSIIDSASPITQDAGSFDRLEHLYMAHMRVILHAYSKRKTLRNGD